MDYAEYVRGFRAWAPLGSLDTIGEVVDGARRYPFLRLVVPGERWVTVTAGFHGDEQAGPLTLLTAMGEVAAYAREREVGLRIYPCCNPTGFEDFTRYNRAGQRPNNELIRYEVARDVWKNEVRPDEPFIGWGLRPEAPAETRALLAELEGLPAPAAALDIHQDPYHPEPGTYAYVFGEGGTFAPMVAAAARHAPITRGTIIDDVARIATDDLGLAVYHDASITDYFWRRGVPYVACLETTTATSAAACHEVNMVWLRGFIDLASGG